MIGNGTPYDVREIELTVAVCMGTRELEESPCRRIQLMRLVYRRVRTGPFEPELEPQLLDVGKRRTQSQCCCATTAQPFATAFLCCGRLVGIESHDGSVVRSNRRCNFFCCRGFRDSTGRRQDSSYAATARAAGAPVAA